MPAAAKVSAASQINQLLPPALDLGLAIAIRPSQDCVGVCDVNELRLWPGWIERDPERLIQSADENFLQLGLAVVIRVTQHANAIGLALGDEQIAVRRGDNHARIVEVAGKFLDREARG